MGSSEIYGLQTKLPFDVKEKPNPMSPYAMTKYASELFSILNSKNKKLDLLCVRPFNTFGPRMLKDDGRVISNFINEALNGLSLIHI